MTFEEFLEIPGCTTGKHTTEEAKPVENKKPVVTEAPKSVSGRTEVYGKAAAASAPQPNLVKAPSVPIEDEFEDEDPLDVKLETGMKCKRNGCGFEYKMNASEEEMSCVYHKGIPIFHEGSKGWTCCSRKVLEFEEFLKIKGCKNGKHVFVGSKPQEKKQQAVECRHDWYQSPSTVTISFYCKKVDPNQCSVVFSPQHLKIEFVMPETGVKFKYDRDLFQPIDAESCKFKVMGTKVEVILKKSNGISWPTLEPCENVTSWTTFGISGRTGTVGAKEMHVSNDAPIQVLK